MIYCKIIKTTFHGPTNFRGSRIMAKDDNGNRNAIWWDSSKGIEENHIQAAKELAEKIRVKHIKDGIPDVVPFTLRFMGSLDAKGYVFGFTKATGIAAKNNWEG